MKKRFDITRERWRGIASGFGLPNYFLFDAVVRRRDLGKIFECLEEEAKRANLVLCNTFHAGDGNIHPTPFYDPRVPGIRDRLEEFRDRVCRQVRALDGVLTGEHGIGLEKTHLMPEFFSERTLTVMRGVADVLQPGRGRANDKVLPEPTVGRSPTGRRELHVPVVSPLDGYAVFPADESLANIQTALAETPYEFPFEPVGICGDETIGEAVQAAPPALRALRHGAPRDLLLGGVLVMPDGRDIEFGSLFAKDVSGLDLRKLVFGAQGKLGRLKTVVLKLEPRRERRSVMRIECRDRLHARNAVDRLLGFEALCSAIWAMRIGQKWEVAVLFDGDEPDIEAAHKALSSAGSGASSIEAWSGTALGALGLTSWDNSLVRLVKPFELTPDGAGSKEEEAATAEATRVIHLIDYIHRSPPAQTANDLLCEAHLSFKDQAIIKAFYNAK